MKRYWTGVILIVIGAIFLLDSLGVMEFNYLIRKFWPVILILIGASILWKGRKG
jgi:uncharacterized integral membrane protein